jgi:hypothetical protein
MVDSVFYSSIYSARLLYISLRTKLVSMRTLAMLKM